MGVQLPLMNAKDMIAGVAVGLTFVGYIPYYRDILQGKTTPHVYSWSLWALLTVLLVALQREGGAGSASWVPIAAGSLCVGVALLGLKNGKKDITRTDSLVAVLSLIAMGFWLVVDQPILAMCLVILADTFAFIPTIRKAYRKPYSETLSLYATNAVRFSLAILAVKSYTFLSTAWLAVWALGNGLFSIMLVIRRRSLANISDEGGRHE